MRADPQKFAGLSRRALLSTMGAAGLCPISALAGLSPRVISLDYGVASTMLSLGVVPLGISELADWEKWIVEPRMPASVIDLGSSAEPNLEIISRLRPDLIVVTPYLDPQIPRLETFAPVLRLKTFIYEDRPVLQAVTAATRELGIKLDRAAAAEKFLASMDVFFDDCRRRLVARQGAPVALVSFWDTRHVRIYGNPGLFHDVIERIGLRNAWVERGNSWGFQTIPLEELSRITDPDTQLIALEPLPPDAPAKLARSPLWQSLPLTQPGRFHIIPSTLVFGMGNEAMRLARLLTALLESRA